MNELCRNYLERVSCCLRKSSDQSDLSIQPQIQTLLSVVSLLASLCVCVCSHLVGVFAYVLVLVVQSTELVDLPELLLPHAGQSVRRELQRREVVQQSWQQVVLLHPHYTQTQTYFHSLSMFIKFRYKNAEIAEAVMRSFHQRLHIFYIVAVCENPMVSSFLKHAV